MKRTVLAWACIVACAVVASPAMATFHVEVPAAAIQIQTFGGLAPTLYNTGSVCSAGHLTLDHTIDGVEREKLVWATVLSAKATGARMSFDYDTTGDECWIRYFSVQPN